MKAVLIALLMLSVVFTASSSTSKAFQKKMNDLQDTRMGRTLLNLAQLHSMVQGPIDELLSAIQELIEDLNEELVQLEYDFQRRTNEHNSLVIQYEQDISDAETDIGRTEDVIDNLLIPRRQQIQNKIDSINDNMTFNRKTLAEITLLRQQDQADYEAAVAEYNEGIANVDEAISLLESMVNPSASLIQVKKFQSTINKVSKKTWNLVQNGPIVQAMISLATSQNFSNQGILQQIVEALNEFRNECVNAINELSSQEADAIAAFEERVQQLDIELHEFQGQLNDTNVDMDATVQKINEMREFLSQRVSDRQQYAAQLELENETYANETDIYQNLKAEYLRELAISEQAFSLVNSAEFGSSVNLGKY